jgi:hypothetical protein
MQAPHFVADVPVGVPQRFLEAAPPATAGLGKVIFAETEFHVLHRATVGDASHEAYKARQKLPLMHRAASGSAGSLRERTKNKGPMPSGICPLFLVYASLTRRMQP